MTRDINLSVHTHKILHVILIGFISLSWGFGSISKTIEVSKHMMPSFSSSSNDTIICNGDSALVFLKSLVPTDSVFITNSLTGDTLSKAVDSTGVFLSQAGVYDLIVSDNSTSISKSNTIVVSTPNANISMGDSVTVCYDIDSTILDASTSSDGFPFSNAPFYSYTWSSTNPNIVLTGNSLDEVKVFQTIENRPSNDLVFLEIIDSVGCKSVDSVVVVWDIEIDIEFTDRFLFFCEGESATTTAFVNGPGSVGDFTWSRLRGSSIFTESSDTRSITVTDGFNGSEIEASAFNSAGCRFKDTLTVRKGELEVNLSLSDSLVCTNDLINLNVTIDSVPNTDYSYLWKVNNVNYSTSKNTALTVTENAIIEITVIDEALMCPFVQSKSVSLSVPVATIGTSVEDTIRICEDIFTTTLNASSSSSGTPFSSGFPYLYFWSSPDANLGITNGTSQIVDLENLGEQDNFVGLVELAIEDSIGCVDKDTVWLEWNNQFRLSILEDTLLFCQGEQDTAFVVDNGLGTFSNYQWSNVSSNSLFTVNSDTSVVVTQANNDVITVVAEDEFGCPSNIDSIFVNDILLNANVTPIDDFYCLEEEVNLSFVFDSVSNNPYSYTWFLDDVEYATSKDTVLTVTSNQEVKVIVLDEVLGCLSSDSVNLRVSLPQASTGSLDTVNICDGVFDAPISASTSSNGVPFTSGSNYLYSWTSTNVNLSVSPSDQEQVVATNVNELDFLLAKVDLQITDAIGCVSTDSLFLKWESLRDVVIDKDTLLFCNGTMDSVVASLSGSGSFVSYRWFESSGGGALFSTRDSIADFSSADNSYISVEAVDLEGCVYKDSVFVNSESLDNIIISPINKACLSQEISLSSDFTTYPYGQYSSVWLVDNSFYSSSQDTSYLFNGAVTLKSIVTESVYGCTAIDSLVVIPSLPVSVIGNGLVDTIVSCFGDNDIFLSATSSNSGTLPYSFEWSSLDSRISFSETTLNTTSVSALDNVSDDFSQVFLKVVDSVGCESIDSLTIEWQKDIEVTSNLDNLVCNNINDTIAISSNMTPLNIVWSLPSEITTLNGTTNDTLIYNANNLTGSSTFNLNVENIDGCSKDTSFIVTLQSLGLDLVSVSQEVCTGVELPFRASKTGQTNGLNYTWDLGITNTANDSIRSFSFETDSLVKVSVLDPITGCSASDSLIITINELVAIAESSTDSICFDESAILSLSSVSGGSGFNSFTWTGGDLSPNATTQSVTVIPPTLGLGLSTEYILEARDTLGCTAYDTLYISRNSNIIASVIDRDSLCSDSTIILGNNTTNASGGSGSYIYNWSTTDGTLSSQDDAQISFDPADGISTASITLEIIDNELQSCFVTETINLKVENHLPLTLDDTVKICLFDSTTLRANLNEINGVSFSWSNSTSTGDTLLVKDTLTYYVTATSPLGCLSFDSTHIEFLMPDTISLVGDTNSVCAYDTKEFSVLGSEKGSVNWNVFNAQDVVINDTISIRDSIGLGLDPVIVEMNFTNFCTDTLVRFNFEFFKVPEADFIVSIPEIQQQQPFSLLDASSNADNSSYSWNVLTNNGNITSTEEDILDLRNSEIGFYSAQLILVDDSTACTDTISKSYEVIKAENLIFVPSALNPNAENEDNRVIRVYGTNLSEDGFEFEIFNRWGVSVYKTTSLIEAQTIGWDGDHEENNITAFTYTLVAKYSDGTDINKTGTITLIE